MSPASRYATGADDVVGGSGLALRHIPLFRDELNTSQQCAAVYRRGSLQRTSVGMQIVRDHLQDGIAARHSSGRDPPTQGRLAPIPVSLTLRIVWGPLNFLRRMSASHHWSRARCATRRDLLLSPSNPSNSLEGETSSFGFGLRPERLRDSHGSRNIGEGQDKCLPRKRRGDVQGARARAISCVT